MHHWFTRIVVAAMSDRRGISAMEYAILAAAVLGAVGAAATTLGSDIGLAFNRLENVLRNATGG